MKINLNLGGPFFLLFVIFLVLKLTHNIDWSWAWVTAPLWIGAAFIIVIFLFFLLIAALAAGR